uniref:RRM domain-containing protein n=1 Tax=Timema monikensis TaxID=170555 RepID=A0A7R9HSU1_9NEOP|nr:unnamed protein product [Timema monikensis]
MILKEVYSLLGVSADTHVQHQHSPTERGSSNFLQPLHSDSLLIGSPTLSPVFDSPQVSSRPLVATLPISNHNSSSGFDPPSLSQGVHLASHSSPALNQPPLGMDPTAPPSDIINLSVCIQPAHIDCLLFSWAGTIRGEQPTTIPQIMNDESHPRTLYVGNLDDTVSEELVCALFSQIGLVKGCKIIRESLLNLLVNTKRLTKGKPYMLHMLEKATSLQFMLMAPMS